MIWQWFWRLVRKRHQNRLLRPNGLALQEIYRSGAELARPRSTLLAIIDPLFISFTKGLFKYKSKLAWPMRSYLYATQLLREWLALCLSIV
jgi:hypothetical protein